ncbi:MAG TPA: replication-associated recombination protein A [Acidimicrobiales bacterium]|nr:replication-associated recombination protein A [Acidimicrobiales bacterium]HJM28892.1 replication-associated recombination protein A [Acidimicrobiales bacterium]HJM98411.1 replication-associated recombination protein A [Acidimicrobiales bacterium]
MDNDLFASSAKRDLERNAPLADRLRPQSLDEVIGQKHLLGPSKPLRSLIEGDKLSSVILWGPPGTGKTTIARLIAKSTSKVFVQLSAVNATVKDVREEISRAESRLGEYGKGTILFLDEVHRFNKAQQDSLLQAVESGLIVFVGATTENPYFEINAPLLSRGSLFRLEPLTEEDLTVLINRGLKFERVEAEEKAVKHLVDKSEGDGRQSLTSLEVAITLAKTRDSGNSYRIKFEDVESAIGTQALKYGREEHYDTISAFIKSIRGSDPDAGLYWLARMLDAGEDPRFIARRLVILASEDIGMADSDALIVAEATARAIEYVGLPEAQLNLAHAVIYLSVAPKSNNVIEALMSAKQDARTALGEIPKHLRDSHYSGAKGLGHGEGYKYPHDYPGNKVEQTYRPDRFKDHRYYIPVEEE